MSIGDAEAFAVAAAESREHYRFNPVPDGLADARRYIERALRQRDDGRRMPFTVVWRNRVVGSTSYSEFQPWEWSGASRMQRLNQPDAVEVGYTWLAASAQRTRCNTEAKNLLFTYAFEVWDVYRISLRTDERNARSRRAIERLGTRFEGIRRADMPGQDDVVRNSAFYSIVRDEWPEARERIRGLLAR